MFGVDKHEHDDRYAQGEEWWTIVRRIWSGEAAFDFRRPLLSASLASRVADAVRRRAAADDECRAARRADAQFAIEQSDMHFDGVRSPEESAARIADTKAACARSWAATSRCGRRLA